MLGKQPSIWWKFVFLAGKKSLNSLFWGWRGKWEDKVSILSRLIVAKVQFNFWIFLTVRSRRRRRQMNHKILLISLDCFTTWAGNRRRNTRNKFEPSVNFSHLPFDKLRQHEFIFGCICSINETNQLQINYSTQWFYLDTRKILFVLFKHGKMSNAP